MKLADYVHLDAPTRWRKTWRACLLGTTIDGESKSKDQAVNNVFCQIQRNDANGNKRYYEIANDGTVFAMYWGYDSWCYDIIKPATYVSGANVSSCHMSTPSVTEALEQMRSHARQYGT